MEIFGGQFRLLVAGDSTNHVYGDGDRDRGGECDRGSYGGDGDGERDRDALEPCLGGDLWGAIQAAGGR